MPIALVPAFVPAFVLALIALPLAGCASSPEAAPGAEPSDAAGQAPAVQASPADSSVGPDALTVEDLPLCEREATVTVRVENKSTFDIRISFGGYRPAMLAGGFSRTSYQIARHLLRYDLTLEIIRGGLQVGPPAAIPTEPVFCNIATLVIGGRPQYSVFYGDELRTPKRGEVEGDEQDEQEEQAEQEVPQEPDPAAADSTSIEGSG